MRIRRETMLAIATAALASSACQSSLGGLIKLPGGGSKSSGAGSSGGGAPTQADPGGQAPAGDYSREGQLAKHEQEKLSLEEERAAESRKLQLQYINDNLFVIEPAEGAPRIGATRPSWCDVVPAKLTDDVTLRSAVSLTEQGTKSGWWAYAPRAAQIMCAAPDEPAMQKQVGYYLQYWANITGLDAKGLAPLMKLIVLPEAYDAGHDAACAKLVVGDESSGRDRSLAFANKRLFGCVSHGERYPSWYQPGGSGGEDFDWYYDAKPAPPSELARTHLVLRCMHSGRDALRDGDLVSYALCGNDARALDAKLLEKEIKDMDPWSQATARIAHATARFEAARHDAYAKAAAKKDAIWQTLVYDVPAKAWKEWEALYKANKAGIDAAVAYEAVYDGPSLKAAKGCWPTAFGNLTAYVRAKRPRTPDEMRAAMTDTVGTILLGHVGACAEREGDDAGAFAFRTMYRGARPARGPRSYVAYALFDAAGEATADRPKFKLEPASFGGNFTGKNPVVKDFYPQKVDANGSLASGTSGVVGAIDPLGDAYKVTFKAVLVSVEDFDCVDTNKILGVDEYRRVIYDQKCRKTGSHNVNTAAQPVNVPATWIKLLTKGRYVKFGTAGMPLEVWKDEQQKSLVSYMGIEL